MHGLDATELSCSRTCMHAYGACVLQIKSLTSGCKMVQLSFDTDDQLRAAISFLRRAHPLSHTAPDKKSQVM